MKIFFFTGIFSISLNIFACTDFIIQGEKGSIINGRSMEFGTDLQSQIVISPKGIFTQSTYANGKKGMTWKSRYAYLGLNAFGLNLIVDGMNEKGLAMGALWFPETKYPQVKEANADSVISLMEFGSWILGSFSSLNEVKQALQTVQIWPQEVPQVKGVPPLHFSFHDADGSSMAVEFVNGKMNIYDNKVGVLTNSPAFPWHVTNLRNYINLSAINKNPVTLDGSVLSPTGQGSGLLGIPGDWTPPSRFVRIAVFKNFIQKAKNAARNANLAFHLLNTVDIPYGGVRNSKDEDFDYTQWVVVKDLTNRKLYWRTYDNLNIREIDLDEAVQKAGNNVQKISL